MTDALVTERERRLVDLLLRARPAVEARAVASVDEPWRGDDAHELLEAIDLALVEVTHAE